MAVKGILCPVITAADKRISACCKDQTIFNPENISYMRVLHEEQFPKKRVDWNNAEKAARVLQQEEQTRYQRGLIETSKSTKGIEDVRTRCHQSYREETRISPTATIFDRATMIARKVSDLVNETAKQFPTIGRENILKGYSTAEGRKGGLDYFLEAAKYSVISDQLKHQKALREILNRVSSKLSEGESDITIEQVMEAFNKDRQSSQESYEVWDLQDQIYDILEDTEGSAENDIVSKARDIDKYQRILDNWTYLSLEARKKISNLEGINTKVNVKSSLQDAAITEVSQDSNIVTEDPEESTRGSVHESKDKINPIATMSSEIRAMASFIPKLDQKGQVVTDDLGYIKYLSQKEVIKEIQGLLTGVQMKSEILEKLESAARAGNTTAESILNYIMDITDPIQRDDLLGKLFIDRNKALEKPNMYNFATGKIVHLSSNFQALARRFFSNIENNLSRLDPRAFFNTKGRAGYFKRGDFENFLNLFYADFARTGVKAINPETGEETNSYTGRRPFVVALSNIGSNRQSQSIPELAQKLDSLFGYLGITLTKPVIASLLTTAEGKQQLNRMLDAISRIVNDGIVRYYNKHQTNGEEGKLKVQFNYKTGKYLPISIPENFNSQSWGNATLGIIGLLNNVSREKDKGMVAKNAYKDLLNLIEEFDSVSKTFSYRFLDRHGKKATYYTTTTQSHLYTLQDQLQYYVAAQDVQGYMEWLYYNFLSNPLLCDLEHPEEGYKRGQNIKVTTFYSPLVEELYNTAVSKESDGSYTGMLREDRFRAACEDTNSILNNFVFYKGMGTQDKKFADASIYEHLQMIVMDYFGNRKGEKFAQIPLFILGDANAYKSMVGLRYSSTKTKNSLDAAVDQLYKVFLMENKKFSIIQEAIDEGLTINNFAEKSKIGEFTELPFLNPSFHKTKAARDRYSIDYGNMLSMQESSVKEKIRNYLNDRIDYYLKDFVDKGLLEIEKITKKDSGQTEEVYHPKKVLFKKLQEQGGNKKAYTLEEIRPIIQDMYLTLKMNLIDQVGLLDGTRAFYKNIKDFQKRNKQLHSSGTFLDLEAKYIGGNHAGERVLEGDYSERCVYFKDPKVDVTTDPTRTDLYSALLKLWKKQNLSEREIKRRTTQFKKKVTVTDGQAFRTLDSYRDLMHMTHQWTKELEDVYAQIKELQGEIRNNTLTEQELLEKKAKIANLAVSFKPDKPFTYAFETVVLSDGTNIKVPVQHKCAEAVLIPELLPENSKLKALAEWADEIKEGSDRRNADLLISEEGVKVGCFNVVDITEASGITDAKSLRQALSNSYIHKIPYSGWRQQTNVTDHLYESTLFGTQARKLFFNGIKRDGSKSYQHYLKGKQVFLHTKDGSLRKTDCTNGKDLITFYNQLIQANLIEAFNDVKKAIQSKTGKKLQEILINGALANNQATMIALENFMMTGDNKFILPLFTPSISKDVQGTILSIFKKTVNKQKIAGGAAIQVSPMGATTFKDDGDLYFKLDKSGENVLYGECIIPFELKVFANNGKAFKLNFSDYCNSDGTLKFGRWATEKEVDSGEWQSYTQDGKQFIPKIEIEYPGILDIVAKRIPTERNYSMLRLKVKRFSTSAEGPTIKVPAEGTLLAGFDFDIDKLFLMRKEFRAKKFTEEQLTKIWNDFYKLNPDIKEALLKAALDPNTISDFGKQVADMLLNMEDEDSILEADQRLYKFWSEAGLPGTYTDAFQSYLADNFSKYINTDSNMFQEYDGTLSPTQNTTTARNNMLFQLFCKRLEDSETMESRFTPGGFFNASEAALAIRELTFGDFEVNHSVEGSAAKQLLDKVTKEGYKDPEPEYDYSELSTLLYYNQQNQIADKEIGVFANHNITHAYLYNFDQCVLNTPIALGEHCAHGLYDLIQRDNEEARNYSELMIAELLAASVDAVKDPVLNYLHINTYTANVAALMARLGYSMLEIGLFLNQPIIKEFVSRCDKSGINQDVVKAAMEAELFQANQEKVEFSNMQAYSKDLNTEALIKGIQTGGSAQQQSTVFQVFTLLLSQASALSDITTATKMSASNSVGADIAFFMNQTLAIDAINKAFNEEDSFIKVSLGGNQNLLNQNLDINSPEYFNAVCEETAGLEQVFYDTNKGMLSLLKPYFPQANTRGVYGRILNFLKEASYSGKISEAVVQNVFTDLLTFIQSEYGGNSYFNPNTKVEPLFVKGEKAPESMDAATYFREQFVADFINFRNSFTVEEWNAICEQLPILDALTTNNYGALLNTDEIDQQKLSLHDSNTRIYMSKARAYTEEDQAALINSWADMAEAEDMDFFSGEGDYTVETEGEELTSEQKEINKTHEHAAELNQLLNDTLPKLARYLVYYSFHTTGNTVSTTSFLYNAPASVLRGLNDGIGQNNDGYLATLNHILDGDFDTLSEDQIVKFLKYFVRNHPDMYQFTRNIPQIDDTKVLKSLYIRNEQFVPSFTVSLELLQRLSQSSTGNKKEVVSYFMQGVKGSKNLVKYYPAVKVGNALYISNPTMSEGGITYITDKSSEITYTKVDILGETDKYSTYYEYTHSGDHGEIYEDISTEYQYPEMIEDILTYINALQNQLQSGEEINSDLLKTVSKEVAKIMAGISEYSRPNHSPFAGLKQMSELEGMERAEDIPSVDIVASTLEEYLYQYLSDSQIADIRIPNKFTAELFKELKTFGDSGIIKDLLEQIVDTECYTYDKDGKTLKLCV